jgi:hypothetical protein
MSELIVAGCDDAHTAYLVRGALAQMQDEIPIEGHGVEKYFVRGFYESDFGPRRSWRAGASWDRNEDAGIFNRYIVDGGLGTRWRDTQDLRLYTGYARSFTDREE